MTRQEQNSYILEAIQHQLQDMPDVKENIVDIYSGWVVSLIKAGQSQLAPQPVQPQAQQQQIQQEA